MSYLLIVNSDRKMFRELEVRLVPGHSEVAFCIIKLFGIHEIILSDKESPLEFRHEETSAFQ